MKAIFSVLFLLSLSLSVSAQTLKPVKWNYEVIEKKDNVYEIHFIASMDSKWAIYSQFTSDEGPIPTSFTFEPNDELEFEKGVAEIGDLLSGYDELFEVTVKKFKESVHFVQTVQLKKDQSYLKGYVTYMTCDDLRCLPPVDEEFSILIN